MYEESLLLPLPAGWAGQPQLSPPPLNYVNKQETESLTESIAPHLARGLTFIHCFAAEK